MSLIRNYSFISTLSFVLHISLPLSYNFFRFNIVIRGIVQHGDIWVNLRFEFQRTNLYITHTHTHIYHKLLLLYRYEISTLDVSNFFFLLQTVLRIRGNSFLVPWQASFHSRIPVSCFCPSFYW